MTEGSKEWREEQCHARETVQVGRMCAIDLRCMLERQGHGDGHRAQRYFAVVSMRASWPGAFEERRA